MARQSYQCAIRDDRCPAVPSHHVVQSCNLTHDKITRSARPFYTIQSSTASMTTAPPEKAIRSLLGSVRPNLTVQDIEAVPSGRLQRLYNVKVSDGPSLLLALSPPSVMRLLRSEQSSIGAEAALLTWLSGPVRDMKTLAGAMEGLRKAPVEGENALKGGDERNTAKSLHEYLPCLLEHGLVNGSLYNLSRPPWGVTISALSPPLDYKERKAVDFQIGQFLRCMSTQVSPNGRFGLTTDVLAVPRSTAQLCRFEGGLHAKRGANSWSTAFQALLESVLRDAEDLSIMISYGAIRRHVDRFEHFLEAVTNPRLVAMDIAEDMNTLVFWANNAIGKTVGVMEKSQSMRKSSDTFDSGLSSGGSKGGSDCEDEEDNFDATTTSQGRERIEVTGLRQWSNCIFGDPLIATVFSKHPSRHFQRGFDTPLPGDDPDSAASLVEDEKNSHIRMLLYECYHAVTAVVKEFYRPHKDSRERELVARKLLTSVLARLDDLDNSGGPRRRRPSGEMSPAKRPKPDDADESD
ncbi:Fc.00g012880.m01.CDS01 [Cosmosporella sp. VM-42]